MFRKALFSKFVSEFSILAQEANIDSSLFKKDFNKALTYRLRSAALDDSHTAINEDRKRNKEGPTTASGNARTTKPAAPKATTSPATIDKTSTTPRTFAPLTDKDRIQYRAEGRCFYYREVGHMGKDCPKRLAKLAATTLSTLEHPQGATNTV
ncbi:hypothetical protein BDW59DRAFT_163301 [Aspergillus cavernicola]|uniref:CCHC-type domain-containing protein n=1 Tax=Aspergillus cavernicola TaxID=176166 RepID=A0ABR4I7T9_9EURO